MHVKSKTGSRRRTLLIVSLIFVIVLVSSFVTYKFLSVSDGSMRVKSAAELRAAVNNAEVSVPTTVALTKDIALGTLVIPAGADITLTSAGNDGFFKLIGSTDESVITVQSSGRLTLNGVIVTHTAGSMGCGVVVESGGTLIMVDGEISGNTADLGGGVSNHGSFIMAGGSITDNIAINRGGGIFSGGTFTMSGGVISNNRATDGFGGGVYNYYGTFNHSGGEIFGNIAAVGNDVHHKLTE
jgi:hypothetical protein